MKRYLSLVLTLDRGRHCASLRRPIRRMISTACGTASTPRCWTSTAARCPSKPRRNCRRRPTALRADLHAPGASALLPMDFRVDSKEGLAALLGTTRGALQQAAALEMLDHQRAGRAAQAEAWRVMITLPQFANADDGGLLLQQPPAGGEPARRDAGIGQGVRRLAGHPRPATARRAATRHRQRQRGRGVSPGEPFGSAGVEPVPGVDPGSGGRQANRRDERPVARAGRPVHLR